MVDGGKKPYVVAVAIQAIYTGLFVVSKAAFDSGINTYVFIFYRLAAATAVLLPLALINSICRSRSTNTLTQAPTMSCRLVFKLFLYALLGMLGGILLVGGLYSVLWGKSKENENKITPVVPGEIQSQVEGTIVQEKHDEELTSQV